MSAGDLDSLFLADCEVRRWRAERENATARLELAQAKAARARLLSQYEPVNSLGIDRETLRALLAFTSHHDEQRLKRELGALATGASA
ncbi:hypothetical protein AB8810_12910 [Xanthomonas sp. NCPPB 3005]|uniref:hypothetical protein n=1 Tax=Xanthomonas sp. NCPPB 3005 TaxID=3240913 RepID=UPI0035121293